MSSNMREFEQKSLNTIFVQIALLVINILTGIITARALGPEGKGYLTLLLLVPAYANAFGTLGTNLSINYYYGRSQSDRILTNGLYLALLLGTLSTAIAIPTVLSSKDVFFKELDSSFLLLVCSMIVFTFIYDFLIVNVQALYRIKRLNLLLGIQPLTNLLCLILFVAVFSWNLSGALMAWIISLFISVIFAAWFSKINRLRDWQPDFRLQSQLIGYGAKAHLGVIFKKLASRVDVFIVAYFLNPVSVGLYAVALSLSEVVWLIPQGIQVVLLPWAMKNKERPSDFVPALCRRVFMVVVIVSIALFALGGPVVTLLFGKSFQASYPTMVYMLPGTLAYAIVKVIVVEVYAYGQPLRVSVATGISALTLIVADFLLIPSYGLTGAAIGCSLSYIAGTAVLVISYTHLTNVPLKDLIMPLETDFIFFRDVLGKLYRRPSGVLL